MHGLAQPSCVPDVEKYSCQDLLTSLTLPLDPCQKPLHDNGPSHYKFEDFPESRASTAPLTRSEHIINKKEKVHTTVGHSHSERKRQNCSAPSPTLHMSALVRSGVCTPVLGVGQTLNPRHVRISTEATRAPKMLHSCLFGLRSMQSSHSTNIVNKNQAEATRPVHTQRQKFIYHTD